MNRLSCDILVAGAGPAGSSAARVAAGHGLAVIVAERKPVIGIPVRCAEYIPAPLVGTLALGNVYTVQKLTGMRTFLPNGEIKEIRAPGYTVNRDLLDQAIAVAAEIAGAKIYLGTHVISRDRNRVRLKDAAHNEFEIDAKVIVGADGPHSTVGQWIGSVNKNLLPAAQVTLPLKVPMDQTEIYFRPEIYGGYGWLFPKGDEANVGLGIRQNPDDRKNIGRILDRFLSELAMAGKIDLKSTRMTAGWIPAEPVGSATAGNVMLVGDAAGHTHPITGAGIFQAVVCGQMAGKWAARAIHENNLDLLAEYETEWRDLFEQTLQRAHRRRLHLEQNWDRLDEVIHHCWVAFKGYYAES